MRLTLLIKLLHQLNFLLLVTSYKISLCFVAQQLPILASPLLYSILHQLLAVDGLLLVHLDLQTGVFASQLGNKSSQLLKIGLQLACLSIKLLGLDHEVLSLAAEGQLVLFRPPQVIGVLFVKRLHPGIAVPSVLQEAPFQLLLLGLHLQTVLLVL